MILDKFPQPPCTPPAAATKAPTAWELAQTFPFPPAQAPAQMGLRGADPASPYFKKPYPVETIDLEGPYYLRRCRMALREIAEAYQALLELGVEVPGTEGRVYQRITERYVQFAEPAKCTEGPVS